MPTSYNGIGTIYYGKRNVRTYQAQCEFCRRIAMLQEYETRHWVIVVFVPVISLGRKQILDCCTVCQRHRVMPLAEWEKVKEQTIANETSKFAENSDDPQAAIQLLKALSVFNRQEEAEKLAAGIQQRFDDDAQVQLTMGEWHEFRNRPQDAQHCYRAALTLDPQNVAAKRAVAAGMATDGQPAEALALLLAEPEIPLRQDPQLYTALAGAYGRQGKHDEALTIYEQVLTAVPKLGYDKQYRQLVRTSEKHATQPGSILPRIPLHRRRGLLAAAAVLAAIAAFLGSNFYIATHRTLHLVNGFNRPVQVQVDDGPAITIAPNSRQESTVAEGHHTARTSINGKPAGADEFEVSAAYLDRFAKKPAYILNAGRGAAIIWEEVTYSVKPVGGGSGRLEAGRTFVGFDNADYQFEPFPQTVELRGGRPITKSRVDVLEVDPALIFNFDDSVMPLDAKLAFAEAHLPWLTPSKPLLMSYVQTALAAGQLDRVRSYLASGLDALPVRIEWHRMYETLSRDEADKQKLRDRYAALLKKQPQNSAVLYLAGRLQEPSRALTYFERAIAADPHSPYPWLGKGYCYDSQGDFSQAKEAYAKALELQPADDDFRTRLVNVRFALKEFDALEKEAVERCAAAPLDMANHIELLDVLAAQGKMDEVKRADQAFAERMAASPDLDETQKKVAKVSRVRMLYLTKDYATLLAEADQPEFTGVATDLRFPAHLEQGELAAAAADLEAKTEGQDPLDALLLSVALRAAGNDEQAAAWQAKALPPLAAADVDHARIPPLFDAPADVTVQQVTDLEIEPGTKAIVAVALAQQSPEHRAELLALGEKLNYAMRFPHYYLQNTIAAMREKP